MDPQATLKLVAERIAAGDLEDAMFSLVDYTDWTIRGGFETPELAAEFDRLSDLLAEACDGLPGSPGFVSL